ncbi:MAG: response regulator [bacterium]|nr:response regulator [bacterium]
MDHSQIRVLVVDDETSIRVSLAAYLEDYDFDVTTACSSEEALVLMEHIPFQVGVIDLRLPGMSGDALILMAHQISPSMRFIIHTGSTNYQLTEELNGIGIYPEYLFLKPIEDLTVIVAAVEKLALEGGITEGDTAD